MYVGKVHGKIVRINDDDMMSIMDRYNIQNFEMLNTSGGEIVYRNRIKCPLCEKYYNKNCLGCPFKAFEDYKYGELVYGCEVALQKSTGLDLHDIDCTEDELTFYGHERGMMIYAINKIYNCFTIFKYISD